MKRTALLIRLAVLALACALGAARPGAARAEEFLCGRPASRGVGPTASDALFTLTEATGGIPCKLCVCDVDQSGSFRASDALLILRWAVGTVSTGTCPAPCESACLDGIVDVDEECDDGLESRACDANCTLARCGDGTRNAVRGEECDTHGRSATCDGDCTLPVCGDGLVNIFAGELCDDGNAVDGDGCDTSCTPTGCGKGVVTPGEDCDDGDATANCDSDCTTPACGDGLRNEAAGVRRYPSPR